MNDNQNIFERLICELDDAPGGTCPTREALINYDLDNLSDEKLARCRLEFCRDEVTGHRFGRSACRAGRCVKIGTGRHNKRDSYQIWLVWA